MIGACIKFILRYFAASLVVGFSFACTLVVPALLKEFSLAGLQLLAVFSLLNAIFIAVVALFPTVIAIVVGKLINQHSWLYYAGAGGAVGLLSYLIWFWALPLWPAEGVRSALDASQILAAISIAVLFFGGGGLLGGLTYWALGSRKPAR